MMKSPIIGYSLINAESIDETGRPSNDPERHWSTVLGGLGAVTAIGVVSNFQMIHRPSTS